MKKHIFPIVAAIAIPGIAHAITVNGDATVVILNAISASQTQIMNFGSILPGAAAGTVILSPAGAASSSSLGTHGSSNAGAFTINAQPSTPLTITFGNGSVNSGANSMAVDTFTMTTDPTNSTTNSGGILTLKVGATLHVGANQAPGTYNGTYTVTVSY